jgi:hypothetical protein
MLTFTPGSGFGSGSAPTGNEFWNRKGHLQFHPLQIEHLQLYSVHRQNTFNEVIIPNRQFGETLGNILLALTHCCCSTLLSVCCGCAQIIFLLWKSDYPFEVEVRLIIFKNSFRTAKKIPHFTIMRINCLTLFKEIIAIYSGNHRKHINT